VETIMNCETIQESLVDYYYRDLEDSVWRGVAVHLGSCSVCAMEYCRLEADLSGLADLLHEGPRPELKQALALRVEKAFRPSWWRSALRLVRAPLPAYQAALAVSAIAALFVLLSSHRDPPAPLPQSPVQHANVAHDVTSLDKVDASTIVSVDPSFL
jgi:hypothetical protein